MKLEGVTPALPPQRNEPPPPASIIDSPPMNDLLLDPPAVDPALELSPATKTVPLAPNIEHETLPIIAELTLSNDVQPEQPWYTEPELEEILVEAQASTVVDILPARLLDIESMIDDIAQLLVLTPVEIKIPAPVQPVMVDILEPMMKLAEAPLIDDAIDPAIIEKLPVIILTPEEPIVAALRLLVVTEDEQPCIVF